jgi:hypothetical protein
VTEFLGAPSTQVPQHNGALEVLPEEVYLAVAHFVLGDPNSDAHRPILMDGNLWLGDRATFAAAAPIFCASRGTCEAVRQLLKLEKPGKMINSPIGEIEFKRAKLKNTYGKDNTTFDEKHDRFIMKFGVTDNGFHFLQTVLHNTDIRCKENWFESLGLRLLNEIKGDDSVKDKGVRDALKSLHNRRFTTVFMCTTRNDGRPTTVYFVLRFDNEIFLGFDFNEKKEIEFAILLPDGYFGNSQCSVM